MEPRITVRLQLTIDEKTFKKLVTFIDTSPTRGNVQAVILEAVSDFLQRKMQKVERLKDVAEHGIS